MTNPPPPPNLQEAEEGVIACCLLDGTAYDEISSIVQPEHFYNPAHQTMFRSIGTLALSGQEVDEISLYEQLKKDGAADEVGGLERIYAIQKRVETAGHVKHFAKIVRDKYRLRSIIRVSREAQEAASSEEHEPDEVIASLERAVTAILDDNPIDNPRISAAAEELVEDFKRMADGTYVIDALPTHISQIDQKLSAKGIAPGEVMVIAAPTSCGKTCLALNIALQNGVSNQVPGLYFSFEMQAKALAKRMTQTCAAVNLNQFQDGVLDPEKQKRVWDALKKVQEAPIYTEHYVRNVAELRSRARMYKRKHKIEWIVIDYLQLVPWDSKLKKHDGIAEVSHQIKLMAMELEIPVILLAQVNREGAKRESGLTLYDLKDSGDIENDADIILLLWPDGKDTNDATVHGHTEHGTYISIKYNIAKQREGERDQYGKFVFKNHIGRFI